MRFLGAKFTREEWNALVDAVASKRGDVVLADVLREALSSIPEEELYSLEVRDVGRTKGIVVLKSTVVPEDLHVKLKRVAKKRGVGLQRLAAEAVLKYWLGSVV